MDSLGAHWRGREALGACRTPVSAALTRCLPPLPSPNVCDVQGETLQLGEGSSPRGPSGCRRNHHHSPRRGLQSPDARPGTIRSPLRESAHLILTPSGAPRGIIIPTAQTGKLRFAGKQRGHSRPANKRRAEGGRLCRVEALHNPWIHSGQGNTPGLGEPAPGKSWKPRTHGPERKEEAKGKACPGSRFPSPAALVSYIQGPTGFQGAPAFVGGLSS